METILQKNNIPKIRANTKMRSQKSNFDTKPTQLLQLAPKTKIFMLRWRSSSNQTCSWQSARHRKETGRCGTAKMGMKRGLVLCGDQSCFYPHFQ